MQAERHAYRKLRKVIHWDTCTCKCYFT